MTSPLNVPMLSPSAPAVDPDQFEYRSFTKSLTITLTPNQVLNNVAIPLDKDADFFWEATQALYTSLDAAILPFLVQFSDQSDYSLSNGLMPGCVYMAAQQGLSPVRLTMPAHWFPAGSAIFASFQEISGSMNGPIQFIFRGVKRYAKGRS